MHRAAQIATGKPQGPCIMVRYEAEGESPLPWESRTGSVQLSALDNATVTSYWDADYQAYLLRIDTEGGYDVFGTQEARDSDITDEDDYDYFNDGTSHRWIGAICAPVHDENSQALRGHDGSTFRVSRKPFPRGNHCGENGSPSEFTQSDVMFLHESELPEVLEQVLPIIGVDRADIPAYIQALMAKFHATTRR